MTHGASEWRGLFINQSSRPPLAPTTSHAPSLTTHTLWNSSSQPIHHSTLSINTVYFIKPHHLWNLGKRGKRAMISSYSLFFSLLLVSYGSCAIITGVSKMDLMRVLFFKFNYYFFKIYIDSIWLDGSLFKLCIFVCDNVAI